MTDQEPPDWCAEHAELFRINGVSPEDVLDQVVAGLTKTWQERNDIGYMVETDKDSVLHVLRTVGKGKPFLLLHWQ